MAAIELLDSVPPEALDVEPTFVNRFVVVKHGGSTRIVVGDSHDGGKTVRWRASFALENSVASELEEAITHVL